MLCRLLGVTRQGYYAYAKNPEGRRAAGDAALCKEIADAFEASRETYGSPRVHRALVEKGIMAGKHRVERLMRCLDLRPRLRREGHATTQADPTHPVASNVLARDFTASRPNERWVTDITYAMTEEGACYIAAILDLYSRSVVGWALSTSLSTELPLAALQNAVQRRRPADGLLHHSDRGCQYTSNDYRARLAELGVTVSMSRKGNCWDNAVAESFFATLKTELVYRYRWRDLNELRAALFDYVEVFYNRKRLHSSLNYKTPALVEAAFAKAA
jgi:transposase InsO family protein